MVSFRAAVVFAVALLPLSSLATPAVGQHDQVVLNPPVVPGPSLADLLTATRNAALFYDYLRSSSVPLTQRTVAPAPSYTTIFVPINSALLALSHKPHRGPPTSPDSPKLEYESSKDEEEAHRLYLERWVARHFVADTVVDESGKSGQSYRTLVDGKEASFQAGAEGIVVMPGQLPVVDVITASNGKIVLIDGTLSPEE